MAFSRFSKSGMLGVAFFLTALRSRFSKDCFSPVSAPSSDTRLTFWSSPRRCASIFSSMAKMWTRVEQHITNRATRRRPPRGVTTEDDNFIADRMDFVYFESLWIYTKINGNNSFFSQQWGSCYVQWTSEGAEIRARFFSRLWRSTWLEQHNNIYIIKWQVSTSRCCRVFAIFENSVKTSEKNCNNDKSWRKGN